MSKNKKAAEAAAEAEEIKETPEATQEAAPEEAQVDELANTKLALAAKEKEYLYLRAEYDNYRRRSAKEKTDAYANAKADAAIAFLPVYDNLVRALAAPCTDEAYVKGVEMTLNQLKSVLEKLGITEVDCLGNPFDPNTQNAVMHVDDPEVGENIVVEVFQAGFVMGEKVVREAMVKVAN